MIPWYWVLVAFLLGNAFATLTYELFDWENIWVNIVSTLALIVLYIPMSIYKIFFHNVIHPISKIRHEEMVETWVKNDTSKNYHLFKNIYFWIDPDAKRIHNKIFFIRVKEKREET